MPAMSTIIFESVITCPQCGASKAETMPADACQFFYECSHCKALLRPNAGDCCVFCSFGSVKCPPIQQQSRCCVTDPVMDPRSCDSVRNPSHVLGFWIAPGGIAAAAFLGAGRHPALLLIGAAACVVMGVACLRNAARCHRLHCYITGPYFLLLAMAAAMAYRLDAGDSHHAREWLLLALGLAPLLIWLPERLSGTTYRKASRC